MSSVFIDTDVDVVSISMLSKADRTTTRTVYVSTQYYGSGALYTASPEVFPVLVTAPVSRRSVGNEAAVRHDVSIQLYGRTHLEEYGISFADLLESWEITNQEMTLLYYAKARDAITTHSDSVNKRQVLRALESSYDDLTGVLTIQARDHWFEDKTFSKEMSGDFFTDIDPTWDTEIGAHVFGAAEASKYNTVVDAPFLTSWIDGSNRPNAKLFMGWTYAGHSIASRAALLVRNPYRSITDSEYRTCHLVADPQTAVHGNATFSQMTEPASDGWVTDLSRYSRSIVYQPSSAAGSEVLTAVRVRVGAAPFYRCAKMQDDRMLRSVDPVMQVGDEDFTIQFWCYFDSLHDSVDYRIIARACQIDWAVTQIDWEVFFNDTTDHLRFSILNAAGTRKTVVSTSTVTTGTWYRVTCYHDATNDLIGIYINNSGGTTTATAAVAPQRLGTYLEIGADVSTIVGEIGFDGGLKWLRLWKRLIDSTDSTALWNSGEGLHDDEFTDQLRKGLVVSFPMDEPSGPRLSYSGGKALNEMLGTITYEGTSWAPDVTSDHGELVCEIYHVSIVGDSYTRNGQPLRRASLDISTAAIIAGTDNAYFQIDAPLLLLEGIDYAIELHWTNHKTGARFIRCNLRTNSGSTHYRLDQRADNTGWEKQTDQQLAMELFVLGFGDDGDTLTTTTGDPRYAYIHLEAKSITLSTGQNHLEFNNGLQFKVNLSGLIDDGSGTYTGTASAALTYSADIIHWLLRHSSLLALPSTAVEASTFTAARALQTTAGLKMHIGLEDQISIRDFILELCRQGRLIIYKRRDGKLAVKYPVYSDPTVTLNEESMRGDLILASVALESLSEVVNEFYQLYSYDPLNLPKDAGFVRRAKSTKYLDAQFINPTASTASDTHRQTLCQLSQQLYGRSEMRTPITYLQSGSRVATLQNYVCDRKTRRAKVVRLRVPRRRFFNTLDLFTMIRVEHTGIQAQAGTGFDLMVGDSSGNELVVEHESIRRGCWAGGVESGEIIEVEEEGGYMVCAARTVWPFSSL